MGDVIDALRYSLARSLREGRLDDAASHLERLKREDPLAVQTRGGELELLLRTGRLDEAVILARQLVETFPGSARVLYLAGRVAYRRKEYENAEQLLQESCRLSPHWRTRHWLGKTLTQLNRLSEAEPILLEVVADHPYANTSLAWVYERLGDTERAISALEVFLDSFPDDAYARQSFDRLRARSMGAQRLQEEMETLLELGEELPTEILPEYIESLLRTGQGNRARQVVAQVEAKLDDRTATRIAWTCRKLQAYDLSFKLFLKTLPHNLDSVKFLVALERDAGRAGRLAELFDLYRSHATEHPRLWGRIRSLAKRARE